MTTDAVSPIVSDSQDSASRRLVSVDALRGFDMFWIVGAAGIVRAIQSLGKNPVSDFFVAQLKHKEWDGFAFEDLIFPLFVFIMGISIVFSLGKILEKEGKSGVYRRVFRRFVLMYLLGVFYYGGAANHWPDIRLVGVLPRLALCYLFASLLFCNFRTKGLIIVCVSILAAYWALLSFVPVPGIGSTTFAANDNWACYIDKILLPGKRINGNGTWDPEGLLSTFPAVVSCLLGVFAGLFLKDKNRSDNTKVLSLFAVGAAGVALGFLWGMQFPVIKKIWTSSYVLVAGGYSCIMLAAFYLVVDVWKRRAWATPFLWIGSNALTIYLAVNLVKFDEIAKRFVGGNIHDSLGSFGDLAVTLVTLGLVLTLARFLYNKKIFIRV
jgi:predicted acyltransferase